MAHNKAPGNTAWLKKLEKSRGQLKRMGPGTAVVSSGPDLLGGWKANPVPARHLSRRERREISYGRHVMIGSKKCIRCGRFSSCNKFEIREEAGPKGGIFYHTPGVWRCYDWSQSGGLQDRVGKGLGEVLETVKIPQEVAR